MPYGGRIRGSGRPWYAFRGPNPWVPRADEESHRRSMAVRRPIAKGGRPTRDPTKPGSQAATGLFAFVFLVSRYSPVVGKALASAARAEFRRGRPIGQTQNSELSTHPPGRALVVRGTEGTQGQWASCRLWPQATRQTGRGATQMARPCSRFSGTLWLGGQCRHRSTISAP